MKIRFFCLLLGLAPVALGLVWLPHSAPAQPSAVTVLTPRNAHTVCLTNLMVLSPLPTNVLIYATSPVTNPPQSAVVYNVTAFNYAGSDQYLMLVDWSSLTNSGTNGALPNTPALKVLAGSYAGFDWGPQGRSFSNGLVIAISSTPHTLTNIGAQALNTTNFHLDVNYATKGY